MSNVLTPVITNQGREALMNGFSTTGNYRFSHVALGDGHGAGYDVDPAITALENELQRVTIESVVVQDSNRLHITAVAGLPREGEEKNAYDIHEIGFFLQPITYEGTESDDPILFAVYATKPGDDQKALMTKEPGTELLLAFDLLLPDMSEEDYKFDGNSYLHIRSANQEMAGLVRLAKESDAVSGEANNIAVTPLGVKSAITNAFTDRYADPQVTMEGDSSALAVTPQGLKLTLDSKLASSDEAMAGEVDDKYISPLTLNSVLDEQAVKPGNMEAALINLLANNDEALAGDIDDKAVTPAGLKATLKGFERTSSKEPGETSDTVMDLTINGSASFGASVRQMINLWKTNYGIGVQDSTQYYRTDKNFAWYSKGVHSNDEIDAGKGGKVQMVLNDSGLGIGTKTPKATLTIGNKAGKEKDPDTDMHITANSILFGGNNSGKQAHSAHISAGLHVANSLNIVGMASAKTSKTRKIDMWAEGGLTIRGPVNISGDISTANSETKGNLTVGGAITPSSGISEKNGIMFPKDPFGGGGDAAWIRYYARSGEATTFEIGTSNDANDHIALMSSGYVGIGTNAPGAALSIANKGGKESAPDANMHITANSILFGGKNSGKQTHSAHISAGLHVANSLNIVGMSSNKNSSTRKIDMWAEGGLKIHGTTLSLGNWSIKADGNNLFFNCGTKIVARLSTAHDRLLVFQNSDGKKPYFYFNKGGKSGTYS